MPISSIIREDWYNHKGFALIWWLFFLRLVTLIALCTILLPIPFPVELVSADMTNSRFLLSKAKPILIASITLLFFTSPLPFTYIKSY